MEVGLESQRLRARSRVADGRRRRFLHHVAESAGELELPAAGHDADFDLEDLAPDRRVRESRRDADLVVERHVVLVEGRGPQERGKIGNLHALLIRLGSILRAPPRELARDARYATLEI